MLYYKTQLSAILVYHYFRKTLPAVTARFINSMTVCADELAADVLQLSLADQTNGLNLLAAANMPRHIRAISAFVAAAESVGQ